MTRFLAPAELEANQAAFYYETQVEGLGGRSCLKSGLLFVKWNCIPLPGLRWVGAFANALYSGFRMRFCIAPTQMRSPLSLSCIRDADRTTGWIVSELPGHIGRRTPPVQPGVWVPRLLWL